MDTMGADSLLGKVADTTGRVSGRGDIADLISKSYAYHAKWGKFRAKTYNISLRLVRYTREVLVICESWVRIRKADP